MMPKLAKDKSVLLDEIFNENYPAMMRWANVVAKNDTPLSEDLVHDVFIKCKRASIDLSDIENIKSYLFTAIRNSYLSQLRRRTLRREISITEELPLSSPGLIHDPRISNAARYQLFDICYYACKRKEKSISASVLLLRYFHGYYPVEIKKILKRSQNSVEARMSKVRAEVAEYLCGIERADKSNQSVRGKPHQQRQAIVGDDLITELRSMIFSHSSGRCLAANEWRKQYIKSNEIGREDLSHLVSCFTCLDTVNVLLKLPLLSQRHPLDSCRVQSPTRFLDQVGTAVFATFMTAIPTFIDLSSAVDVVSFA